MIKEVELDKILESGDKLSDKRVKLKRSYGKVTDYVITGTHNGTTYVAVVPYSPKIKIDDSLRIDENGCHITKLKWRETNSGTIRILRHKVLELRCLGGMINFLTKSFVKR